MTTNMPTITLPLVRVRKRGGAFVEYEAIYQRDGWAAVSNAVVHLRTGLILSRRIFTSEEAIGLCRFLGERFPFALSTVDPMATPADMDADPIGAAIVDAAESWVMARNNPMTGHAC